ncbi:hypothetical protein LTR65_004374 [Meristemomyces frigidus]
MARRFASKRRPVDEDVIRTEPAVKYKDDRHLDALDGTVDADKDFISALPTETLHNVFSYLILDHDAERGVNIDAHETKSYGFKDRPHVLLALSTMSRHFRANIEGFSCHHLTRYKETYRFTTTTEAAKGHRRSPRLAAKVKPQHDLRIYRVELVKHLQAYCFQCGVFCNHRATMANGVVCCRKCEERDAFPAVMNLSEALREFDLRDYMLIKTRVPGPRAKHKNLPGIPYATVRTGMGYGLGMCVSYKFYRKDVQMIARLVHGDVGAHMLGKAMEQIARKDEKLRRLHVELKIRFHTDVLAKVKREESKEYHQTRLDEFQSPEWDGDWRWAIVNRVSYGQAVAQVLSVL